MEEMIKPEDLPTTGNKVADAVIGTTIAAAVVFAVRKILRR